MELSESPKILLLSTMRNEGPFVLEWLAHHRALGVTDALIYSNDCDDGTDALLDILAGHGLLTHVRHEGGGKSVQWRALRAAKDHPAYLAADWVLGIDCDEFVVLTGSDTDLPGLLGRVRVDAIMLTWRLFGAGGQLAFDVAPVTERLVRAAPEAMVFPAAARFFKTLYRRGAFARPGVHRPKAKQRKPAKWVDGAGEALTDAFALNDDQILSAPNPGRAMVQLNHYSLRSAEDFMVKRRRGLPNKSDKALDASYWAERNFNTVEDRSAERHAPTRQDTLKQLMAMHGVADAHAACVAAHSSRIAEILADPVEARLFTRLALLKDSTPPQADEAKRLLSVISATR